MESGFSRQRRSLDNLLIPGLWLHIPVIAGVAAALSGPAMTLALTATLLAAAVTIVWRASPNAHTTRILIAVAAVGMVSLLLAAARDSRWQVDIHMYYFAILAMLAAYCDILMIAGAAAAIFLHHMTLNFVAPAFVFPGGTDTSRVIFHGVVVMAESLVLGWMCLQIAAKLHALDRSLAIIEFTADGTIIDANSNFLAAVGYSLAEIRGKHHSMFLEAGARDTDGYKKMWQNLQSGKSLASDFRRIAKDGHEVWLQATYNPVFSIGNKVHRVLKVATDITDLKRKEELELQKQARRTAVLQGAVLAFEAKVGGLAAHLSASASAMEGSAQTMSGTASQTREQAATVAAAAERASADVALAAAATEQLAASILEQIANVPSRLGIPRRG